MLKGEMKSVSVCRNKDPQSDFGTPFLPGSPRKGYGGPSSGFGLNTMGVTGT